jgi:prophage DNA circulation protein
VSLRQTFTRVAAALDAKPASGWQAKLRPGSFRGVAFLTESHEASGGQRLEVHEFPERDLPWSEELGRKARRWSVEALVIGEDYIDQRDALIVALDAPGAGTLMHRYFGAVQVKCEEWRVTESSIEGRIARFSLSFVEAGEVLSADAKPDTTALVHDRAHAAQAKAKDRFTRLFSVAGNPAFVEGGAARLIAQFATVSAAAGLLLGGSGRTLRAFQAGLALLPAGAVILVRSAIDTAGAVQAIITALGALGGSPRVRVAALRLVASAPEHWVPVLGATPVRAAERANQAELAALITVSALAEAVVAASVLDFSSYEEAVGLRDALADQIDTAATRAADLGDDDQGETLDGLRRVIVRDVTARGGSLVRLFAFTPVMTQPALVIAHRVYGISETLDRADEIVARNRVRHPGFVPGGRALELRTAA